MVTWIKSNRLLSIMILVCMGFFAHYTFSAVSWILYPNSVDYGEGFVMYYAKLWANGTWSWDINTPPYLTMVYGVGFPILATPFVNVFGADLWVGRTISFASALVVCALLYLIVKRLTGKRSLGLLAALLPATQPIFRDWSVLARVDMPAVMFDMIGFYLVVRLKDSKWLYLAIVPFLCAMMIKLTAIAGLVAVGIYLLIYNRKRLPVFVGLFVAGLVAIMIPLMAVSGGTYWNHVILYQNTIMNFHYGSFLHLLNKMIYPLLIMMVLAIGYLRRCWHERDFALAGIFFIVAFFIDSITTFRPGSASMYYFEAIIATCICACLGLPYVLVYYKRWRFQVQDVVIVIVMVALFGFYCPQRNLEYPDSQYNEAVATVKSILADSQAPIITENPAIALSMGKDLYIEYFVFTNMTRLGYWDETPYIEKYKEQYFDYVVLRGALDMRVADMDDGVLDDKLTNEAIRAIAQNYTLIYESVNRYYPHSLYLYEANGKLENDDREIVRAIK